MPQSKFLSKASRVLHILALCGFLLPFITVSCGGMTFLEFSGLDLVIGGEPGGMGVEMMKGMGDELERGMEEASRELEAEIAAANRELDRQIEETNRELGITGTTTPEPAAAPEPAPQPAAEPEKEKDDDLSAKPEPRAIIALLMVLAGLAVAFFLPNRTGVKVTIATGLVAFVCVAGMYSKAKGEVGEQAKAEIGKSTSLAPDGSLGSGESDMPGMTATKKDPKVEVKPGIGMVLVFGLLITIVIMAIRALRNERWEQEIATVGPPGAPPGSPPGAGPGSGSPPPGA